MDKARLEIFCPCGTKLFAKDITGDAFLVLQPCQTCLAAARKAAGDDGYVNGYDKAITDLDWAVKAVNEAYIADEGRHPEDYEEPITSDAHELEAFNSDRARGGR